MMTQIYAPSIDLITDPTHEMLAKWWAQRTENPDEVMYAFFDASPGFQQFLERLEQGEIICAMTTTEEGELTATAWLHDLLRDQAGVPRVGWLGGYVFPNYRGAPSIASIQQFFDYFEELGIQHIHASVAAANRRSIAYIRNRRFLAFSEVCTIEGWTKSKGKPVTSKIFTRNPGDEMLAWLNAQELTTKNNSGQENYDIMKRG